MTTTTAVAILLDKIRQDGSEVARLTDAERALLDAAGHGKLLGSFGAACTSISELAGAAFRHPVQGPNLTSELQSYQHSRRTVVTLATEREYVR